MPLVTAEVGGMTSATEPTAAATSANLHAEALTAWEGGKRKEATDLLRRAASEAVDVEILNDLAVMLADQGDTDGARAVLSTVLSVHPGLTDARENLAALGAGAPASGLGEWRQSATLGGPDPAMPERAFPGMPAAAVMREHALRYSFTLDLVAGREVLDLGCGTGYGSEMLTWTAASVRGFDLWEPQPHEVPQWQGGAVLTYGHDLCTGRLPEADVAVMFEVIEHLDDAPKALRTAWGSVGAIIGSFPNPVYHGSHHNPFHVNDWTLDEFEQELGNAASVRFSHVQMTHFHQDYTNGSNGMILPGRDPNASYWIVVAQATR
jgi:Methyltransferase domain